jgi:hypothetical protein
MPLSTSTSIGAWRMHPRRAPRRPRCRLWPPGHPRPAHWADRQAYRAVSLASACGWAAAYVAPAWVAALLPTSCWAELPSAFPCVSPTRSAPAGPPSPGPPSASLERSVMQPDADPLPPATSLPPSTSSDVPAPPPPATVVLHPHTRSHNGVHRPKERTDDTVAWIAPCLAQA